MKAVCVTSLLRWMRRSDPRHVDVTLPQLFRLSYFAIVGHSISEQKLQYELAEFAKGGVPWYVARYMRKSMYPLISTYSPNPKPPVIY